MVGINPRGRRVRRVRAFVCPCSCNTSWQWRNYNAGAVPLVSFSTNILCLSLLFNSSPPHCIQPSLSPFYPFNFALSRTVHQAAKPGEEISAHCTGQYFDFWHCVDHCVSPPLVRVCLFLNFLPSSCDAWCSRGVVKAEVEGQEEAETLQSETFGDLEEEARGPWSSTCMVLVFIPHTMILFSYRTLWYVYSFLTLLASPLDCLLAFPPPGRLLPFPHVLQPSSAPLAHPVSLPPPIRPPHFPHILSSQAAPKLFSKLK